MKISSIKKVCFIITACMISSYATAADYVIDNKGAHASINFKIKHLGYSWLIGRFDTFGGTFSYDPTNISASKISVDISTKSINSNHADRDKHLKSDDFLDVSKFSKAQFVSSSFTDKGNDNLEISGDLTLHGVSKNIIIQAKKVGEGKDPWGGYRVGFSGTTTLTLKDYDIKMDLGPASAQVEMQLYIEGIKK